MAPEEIVSPEKARLPAEKIMQALVLFDEKNAKDYGLALWAAFHEVEQFYRPAAPDTEYSRYYICPEIPEKNLLERAIQSLGNVFAGNNVTSVLDLIKPTELLCSPELIKELSEPFRRGLDRIRLAKSIRKIISVNSSEAHLMIVTDRAFTPPPRWRYIIWDVIPHLNASVISVATLDPFYWRDMHNPNRVLTVKTRMRSVAMSVIGEQLGLKYCQNPNCFMFDAIDSVAALDLTKLIGAEHKNSIFENRFFNDSMKDPSAVLSFERKINLSDPIS